MNELAWGCVGPLVFVISQGFKLGKWTFGQNNHSEQFTLKSRSERILNQKRPIRV